MQPRIRIKKVFEISLDEDYFYTVLRTLEEVMKRPENTIPGASTEYKNQLVITVDEMRKANGE
jgi:hypothetical protein